MNLPAPISRTWQRRRRFDSRANRACLPRCSGSKSNDEDDEAPPPRWPTRKSPRRPDGLRPPPAKPTQPCRCRAQSRQAPRPSGGLRPRPGRSAPKAEASAGNRDSQHPNLAHKRRLTSSTHAASGAIHPPTKQRHRRKSQPSTPARRVTAADPQSTASVSHPSAGAGLRARSASPVDRANIVAASAPMPRSGPARRARLLAIRRRLIRVTTSSPRASGTRSGPA